MNRIGVVTGTRAEYGLLKPLIKKINEDENLELCLIVTGMHLEEKFGNTYKEIEKDGLEINYKIPMNLKSDSSKDVCGSMGQELILFSETLEDANLDLVVLLGDRFETQIAAVAATIFRIPIAHLHGGELTEGLIDEAIRHSITKMSNIHFTSTEEYAKRVIQMGENPKTVFNVGAIGVENIKRLKLLSREELCEKFGDIFSKDYIMLTFHPVTLECNSAERQIEELLKALDKLKNMNFVFTYANADPEGDIINRKIEEYVYKNVNTIAFTSMGQMGYLSALKYCKAVLGNSSSGIIEAPSFRVPTINIGDRQAGRVRAKTVIDCGNSAEEIYNALEVALNEKFLKVCKKSKNPYEGVETSETILAVLKEYLKEKRSIKKKFYDIAI